MVGFRFLVAPGRTVLIEDAPTAHLASGSAFGTAPLSFRHMTVPVGFFLFRDASETGVRSSLQDPSEFSMLNRTATPPPAACARRRIAAPPGHRG